MFAHTHIHAHTHMCTRIQQCISVYACAVHQAGSACGLSGHCMFTHTNADTLIHMRTHAHTYTAVHFCVRVRSTSRRPGLWGQCAAGRAWYAQPSAQVRMPAHSTTETMSVQAWTATCGMSDNLIALKPEMCELSRRIWPPWRVLAGQHDPHMCLLAGAVGLLAAMSAHDAALARSWLTYAYKRARMHTRTHTHAHAHT